MITPSAIKPCYSMRETAFAAFIALVIAVGVCLVVPLWNEAAGSPLAYAAQGEDAEAPRADAAAPAAVLDGWSQNGNYWYYHYNGVPASGWKQIYHSGVWDYYYFVDGRMQTGWLVWGGGWFYLADTYGQGIGFGDPQYGTMRTGWQLIKHAANMTDWYYFAGGGSGRMQTGWLTEGNHTYYLADEAVGSSFNAIDYGTALHGLHKIGAYNYYFYTRGVDVDLSASLLDGELVRNTRWFAIMQDGMKVQFGSADANGRVTLFGFDEEGPEAGPME